MSGWLIVSKVENFKKQEVGFGSYEIHLGLLTKTDGS